MVKALYIFTGVDRNELGRKVQEGTAPDTSFFGFNHVKADSEIDADYIQITKDDYKFKAGLVRKYQVIHALYLLWAFGQKVREYDVVFLATSAYLHFLFLHGLGFFRKQRFVLINIDLVTVLKKRQSNILAHSITLRSLRSAEKIVCLSRVQVDYLKGVGLTDHQLIFIPFGVDKYFYKVLPEKGSSVFTVGRDVGRDYKTFLEAARIIDNKVVIICSKKNLEGYEIPQNVTVLYDLYYDKVQPYYEDALCVVVPSKPNSALVGSDCSGQTVILDAMANGRAVVATESAWIEDYFVIGKHLLVVPPGDPQAMAQAIKLVTEDCELRADLVNESHKLIEAKFNSKAMGQKIAEVIKSA